MVNQLALLRAHVAAGIPRRWPTTSDKIRKQIEFELSVFDACGRVAYCLMALGVADAIREAGGLVGPGRGACASSVVLYALGITNVDPLKHELAFEIFLHPEKKVPPPILIDTDSKGEAAAHAYLGRAYGEFEELPHRAPAPQLIMVNGWEIGLTRTLGLNRVAAMGALPAETGTGDFDSLKRRCLYEALSYPGLTGLRGEMLRRIHGESEPKAAHPILGEICGDTFGLVIYQEQIVRAIRRMAGFSGPEADLCRKAICHVNQKRAPFRDKFIAGCLGNPEFRTDGCRDEDVARCVATEIWNDFERNGRYACMKAQVVCAAALADSFEQSVRI